MKNHHLLHVLVKLLLIVGGLNWGLVGLFEFNLIDAIFGDMHVIARIIYVLVGFAAAYKAVMWIKQKGK